ncbi:MAG: inositol monophosphatase [Planctomycetota bacterium]
MSRPPTTVELRKTACDLAQLGATEAKRWLGKVTASRKSDNTPVTEADHAAQEAILYHLAHRFPDHAILVEEDVAKPLRHESIQQTDYCWLIDPIDGTRNFARGVRLFAVSVAVLHQGRPVACAIYDATTDMIYSASSDEGAFRGNEPMVLADRPIESDATVAISSFRKRSIPPAVRAWMDHYLFRNHGSVALHLAWVAAGLLDAAYTLECKLWDAAAGALLIEMAGGRITNHNGAPLWPLNLADYANEDIPLLAGTPTLHSALLESLRS